jgi:hypothetical protein
MNFFTNIHYTVSKVPWSEYILLDDSIYKFFVSKIDLRNQFFSILTYKLVPMVAFEDC